MGFDFKFKMSISIHTLCEEGDVYSISKSPNLAISIHTLCEEGDIQRAKPFDNVLTFQSTPSVKRATIRPCSHSGLLRNFNPHPL